MAGVSESRSISRCCKYVPDDSHGFTCPWPAMYLYPTFAAPRHPPFSFSSNNNNTN